MQHPLVGPRGALHRRHAQNCFAWLFQRWLSFGKVRRGNDEGRAEDSECDAWKLELEPVRGMRHTAIIMKEAHPLDHLVLPTASLPMARERLSRLGFTVAPDGVHPFGTKNCCVYLADGTFMEPLAIGDPAKAERADAAGNVFVQRDAAYRREQKEDGFSAVVFGTDDAHAGHGRYVEAGISAGNMLEFSRPFIDAAGNSDAASFRLAFAADGGTQGTFVFACQRLNAPQVDRSALQIHANGAEAVVDVIVVAANPAHALNFLARAAGVENVPRPDGSIMLSNARLTVLDPAAFAARFGVAADAAPSGLHFAAVVFSVANLETAATVLVKNDIAHDMRAGRIVVAPASGQGAVFIFEGSA
jgi:hypothetical protein